MNGGEMAGPDLLIVGGAEKPARAEIMRAFVALSARREGSYLILPAATEDPAGGLERMRSGFAEIGVDPRRVELLEVSGLVPGWERGAWDERQIEKIALAAGIWFLGGDQNRIVDLLLDAEGGDSPLLAEIRLASSLPGGPALGGTSAGAAVMSDPMIAGGTSFGALALPRAATLAEASAGTGDERRLLVRRGLGFFPEGIVDQHFDARSRLGRLVEAAIVEDGARRLAFGIAEATGLRYDAARRELTIVGLGGILVVDVREARRSLKGGRTALEGIRLHLLNGGDRMGLGDGEISFGDKAEIGPDEASFSRVLLDNDPSLLFHDAPSGRPYARSLLVEELRSRSPSLAWELRFLREDGGSRASRLFHGGSYSFRDLILDILPIDIDIHRP